MSRPDQDLTQHRTAWLDSWPDASSRQSRAAGRAPGTPPRTTGAGRALICAALRQSAAEFVLARFASRPLAGQPGPRDGGALRSCGAVELSARCWGPLTAPVFAQHAQRPISRGALLLAARASHARAVRRLGPLNQRPPRRLTGPRALHPPSPKQRHHQRLPLTNAHGMTETEARAPPLIGHGLSCPRQAPFSLLLCMCVQVPYVCMYKDGYRLPGHRQTKIRSAPGVRNWVVLGLAVPGAGAAGSLTGSAAGCC
jgi:hypothetical protein